MPPLPVGRASNAGLALVTGGTSGIGREVSRGLAERGFDVVVAARHASRGEALIEDLRAAGHSASFAQCDLSSAAGAAALASALQGRGPLSLLVNAAGTMGGSEAETMAVNAVAPAVLALALLPSLSASPAPRVVNVASSAHLRASRVAPALLGSSETDRSLKAYAASKLALLQVSTLLSKSTANSQTSGLTFVWALEASTHSGAVGPRGSRSLAQTISCSQLRSRDAFST